MQGSAEFLAPETRAMQDDDTANPGMLGVLDGEALWNRKAGSTEKSCSDCHDDARVSMKGVAARYPAYDKALARYERAAVRVQVSLNMLNLGQAAIIATGLTVITLMAAGSMARGEMTIGSFVLINTYLIQLYQPLNFLGMVYMTIKQGLVDMEQMFTLMQVEPEITDALARALERQRRRRRHDECVLELARPDENWWLSFATDTTSELPELLPLPLAESVPLSSPPVTALSSPAHAPTASAIAAATSAIAIVFALVMAALSPDSAC